MSEYTNVTSKEMSEFLKPLGFQQLNLPNCVEQVYGKRVHAANDPQIPLTLRIYTGIAGNDSREKGEDAIRPALFWRNPQGEIKMIAKGKRVHRVKGWRSNLKKRIETVESLIPKHFCPKCKAPLVERKSKTNGNKFLGCCNFPACKHTQFISSIDN